MDTKKKKDPMDIFAGTSAAMGQSPLSANPVAKKPAPVATVQPAAPQPIGTQVGNFTRNAAMTMANVNEKVANTGLKVGEKLLNAASYPRRAVGGAVMDAGNAFAGNPQRAGAGTPIPGVKIPAVTNPVPAMFNRNTSGAVLPPNAPGATPQKYANGYEPLPGVSAAQNAEFDALNVPMDVIKKQRENAAIANNAAAAPIVANAPTAADANAKTPLVTNKPGDMNTYTNSQGVTTAVSPVPPAQTAPVVTANQPFTRAALDQPAQFDGRQIAQNVVSDQRGVALEARADAGRVLNPMSNDGELMRRAENAAGSYFLKGKTGARNAIVGQYLDQIGAGNKASAAYQDGANEAFTRGQAGDIQGGLNQQQTKGQAVVQDLLQSGNERLERIKNENQGSMVQGADGNTYFVRGTNASAITGPDGEAFKGQKQNSGLTANNVLESLTTELKGYDEFNDPDGTQRAAVRAQLNELRGGGESAKAPPEAGTERNGYRFKGGNPADKANWEKVK